MTQEETEVKDMDKESLTNRELYLLRMTVLSRMAVCPGSEHNELKAILEKLEPETRS